MTTPKARPAREAHAGDHAGKSTVNADRPATEAAKNLRIRDGAWFLLAYLRCWRQIASASEHQRTSRHEATHTRPSSDSARPAFFLGGKWSSCEPECWRRPAMVLCGRRQRPLVHVLPVRRGNRLDSRSRARAIVGRIPGHDHIRAGEPIRIRRVSRTGRLGSIASFRAIPRSPEERIQSIRVGNRGSVHLHQLAAGGAQFRPLGAVPELPWRRSRDHDAAPLLERHQWKSVHGDVRVQHGTGSITGGHCSGQLGEAGLPRQASKVDQRLPEPQGISRCGCTTVLGWSTDRPSPTPTHGRNTTYARRRVHCRTDAIESRRLLPENERVPVMRRAPAFLCENDRGRQPQGP